MKIFSYALVFCCLVATQGFAQEMHSDVEFGYEGGSLIFESDITGIDAAGVFEAEFEVFNMDGTQEAEDPGFASNFTEGDETFMVTSGDDIFVNVNQSATLGSFLTYYNPVTGQFESTSATMTIEDNSPQMTGGTLDLIVSESGLIGDTSQYVDTSDGGEFDSHVDFILSSGAANGAYGLLINIESSNASGDLTNGTTSENFWIVFNNGLTEEVFEASVDQFATAIPEPSAVAILLVSSLALARRNRK